MSGFSQQELQKRLYETLTADTTLMALISGVYDQVNPTANFPFVVIGEGESRDRSTKTTTGAEVNFTLYVYSREGGRKQTLTILERLHALLHQASLALTGHTLVLMRFIASDTALLSDGLTTRGTARFRAITQSN